MVAGDRIFRWFFKPLLFVSALVPAGMLVWGAWQDELGANPLETVTHSTGDWALRFLLLTLAMTPLRRLLHSGWPLRLRRMLGLFAFFYASLHFLIWLLLVPLALTSTRGMMRRLGRNWSRLHRLVYPIAILGVLHYLWLVKADLFDPLVYGAILALLLLARLNPVRSRLQLLALALAV